MNPINNADVRKAMHLAKLTSRDIKIAFAPEHDHMACAKCLGPRLKMVNARNIYQKERETF